MTYTETVTKDGETSTSALSDLGALNVLRRGLRLGASVLADRDGSVTITRTVLHPAGEDVTETKVIVVLRPEAKPSRLTRVQYEDMKRVQGSGKKARVTAEGRITCSGMCRIPTSAAKRLLDRGLIVVVDQDGTVVPAVAGLLAMATYEHQARTTAPRGWHYPEGACINTTRNHRAHPYQVLDRVSTALCSCGGLRKTFDGRPYAAAAVRDHVAEHLSAALAVA